MYDCIMTINKSNGGEYDVFEPLSEQDKKELHTDIRKIMSLFAKKLDTLDEENGVVAINARTTSNRYFDIIFSWFFEDEEIVVKYDRLKETDLDGYLDSINRNKRSSGEKIEP